MSRTCTRFVNGKEYQVPIFPMDVMSISQGCFGSYSHNFAYAIDSCGKDTGIDPIFAPVDLIYKAHDTRQNGNCIWFESTQPVLWADGTIDYITVMFIHDDYIDDVLALAQSGHTFRQGEEFLDEGTAGNSTGNHSHIEVAPGRFHGTYAHNGYVWHLPDSISHDRVFVVDGITLLNNGQPWWGLGNTMYWKFAPADKPVVNASGFSDVPEGTYFFNSIKWAKDLGLVTGSDNKYRPLDTITRADALVPFYRLKGSPETDQINPFTDVNVSDYFYKAIMWATLAGITTGTGQKFRPKDAAIRAEIVTFLYRLCGSPSLDELELQKCPYCGHDIPVTKLPFEDVDENDYFFNAVCWAYHKGIVKGKTDDLFDPYGLCSRADYAVMLDRTYHRK